MITQRLVAIKLLRRALAYRPEMRRRFLRESRAAAAINHPNIIEVLDAFELEDGTPGIVMPLLEGRTLFTLINDDAPLAAEAALAILLPVVAAVAAMHAHGIVHRDLKPENVFLSREAGATSVKVLDFGVAKLAADEVDDGTPTAAGTLLGTPAYMAPEQALGESDQDYRVDIWAIGAIAYQLLSGCRPVEGENSAQVIKNLLTQAVTPLQVLVPGLPGALNQTVMQMLSRSRYQRPSLAEVLTRLQPLLALDSRVQVEAAGSARPFEKAERHAPLSGRPSVGALAVYSTVKPPSGSGSTLQSPLLAASSRKGQRVLLAAAAIAIAIAVGSLAGLPRHPSRSPIVSLESVPAARPVQSGTVANPAASSREAIDQGQMTVTSVGLIAPVQAPIAHPRHDPRIADPPKSASGKPLRADPVEPENLSLDDKRPRPIDRTNPFVSK